MLVSIVVLNHNFARFVEQAILSALAQDYRHVEVVVVDNGSTDDSLAVIRRHEDRVRLVQQPVNIGHGQGYNLGFAAARGDWLVWLEGDHLLDPDAISTCMALVRTDTSKVQYPLRQVDAEGRSLSAVMPFLRHHGDVVPIIRRFGHYAGPPSSGNLYRRAAIAPYFPVHAADWPIRTDTVPYLAAAFHGQVVDTQRPLGAYRQHRGRGTAPTALRGQYNANPAIEARLRASSRDKTLQLLRERGGFEVPGPFLDMPGHLRHRIVSFRWAPEMHPFAEDTVELLWRRMNESLTQCPGYTGLERLSMRVWTLGMLYLPRPLVQLLVAADHFNVAWVSKLRLSRRLQ